MKALLRTLFGPLLKPLEAGAGDYIYKPSHRKALLVLGALFAAMASFALYVSGLQFAVVVFYCVGAVALAVGGLGSDRAVAKIWGSR